MRIGLVSDTYLPAPNGVATSLAVLREALLERGHHVVTVAPTMPGDQPDPDVRRVPAVTVHRSTRSRFGLLARRRLADIARREQFDVFHTHTEFSLGWAARQAAIRLGIPLVHTLHTDWAAYRHYLPGGAAIRVSVVDRYLRRFLGPYGVVTVPSQQAIATATRLGLQRAPVVIGNGSGAHFRPSDNRRYTRRKLGLRDEDELILSVGRVAPEKRSRQLVTSLIPLLRSRDTARLALVGSGPDMSTVRRLVRRSEIADRILLPGIVPWPSMPEWYGSADVYVSASLSEHQSVAALEAQACGVPVIARQSPATDHPAPPAGTTVVPTDAALAARVAEELHRPSRRAPTPPHSIAASIEVWEACYRGAIEDTPRGPATTAGRLR